MQISRLRRVVSLVSATALTVAGALLLLLEAASPNQIMGKLWIAAAFMFGLGALWVIEDVRDWQRTRRSSEISDVPPTH